MASLLLGPTLAEAVPLRDPLDVQGLELADGRVMDPPHTPVWGHALATDPRLHVPGLVVLRDEVGPIWVAWSPEHQAPSGIITRGIAAPDTVASPTRAEAFALAWIERHLQLLAPGSSMSDFVVVANDLSSGMRTVGLQQHHAGMPVLGGQLSLRFKADRLVFVASQSLPWVSTTTTTAPLIATSTAQAEALAWIARDHTPTSSASSPTITSSDGPFVLPVWSGSAWTYHTVVRVGVRSTDPLGAWAVYVDAHSGAPVAREQQMHSIATVQFDVPLRHANSVRYDAVAPQLAVTQSGMGTTTNLDGEVTLTNSPTNLDLSVVGPIVGVETWTGPAASATFPVSNGDTVVWSAAGDELVDAQLSAFVHASVVKAHVRTLAPGLTWLDQYLDVNVNINGSCNASSDGDAIYFLRADGSCQNTALLADVVYHEVGHSVHSQSIIQGVGAFNSALSEGISDYLAATIVNDSGMGRGFTYTDAPLRELNPQGSEWTWPQDQGEAHYEGQIIGGTLWDLRTALRAKLGAVPGTFHTDRIWYESIRRAVDIPSMYPEALAFDDDDGNLANGTPNGCEINAAFAAHGLLDPTSLGEGAVDLVPVAGGRQVTLSLSLPVFDGCPLELSEAELRWRLRGDPEGITTTAMTAAGGAWVATIPTQDTGVVVEYQVSMTYSSGTEAVFPNNAADPWYQTFFGAVIPIYCLDDAADPGEWTLGNAWSIGPLAGDGGIDPATPYDDDDVALEQPGTYSSNTNSFASGPLIDISGHDDVRLHYRRWLTVEDGFYDRATLYANGEALWANLATEQTTVHHVDREWRFHDLPLDDFLDGEVELSFRLQSDGGLQFGGWTIDALCVVEVVDEVCGDDQVTGSEECDDGNLEDGDGCDATCMSEEPDPPGTTGGDTSGGSMGTGESGAVDGTASASAGMTDGMDEGSSGDGAGAGSDSGGCGCTSGNAPGGPLGAMGLLLLTAGGLRRRRRRAR